MKKNLSSFIKALAAVIILSAFSLAFTGSGYVYAADTTVVDNQMLAKINALRASQGLAALTIDPSLTSIAEIRADEASVKWSHTRPNGAQGVDMISSDKWRGENLSYVNYPGYTGSADEQNESADIMFDSLVASPTHYDNMVFDQFTKIGIATSVKNTAEGTRLTTAYMFSN